jgi:nucleoside 2-deoxyribosyltransferase/sugar/nucleoside kinase (ribokinase family)
MTAISVVGGVYHERCIWPDWDQLYGSGGRAAAAMAGHGSTVHLYSYATSDAARRFEAYAKTYGFTFTPTSADQTLSFDYVHAMATPIIRPNLGRINNNASIEVSADVVLRFGMLEGSGRVTADRCIYDPQSAFQPEPFHQNGSQAKHLAIVANGQELLAMAGGTDPIAAARQLLDDTAEIVVAKLGAAGAHVITKGGDAAVPAFRTDRVFTIGSGDVFAATFARLWGVDGREPVEAANLASKAVASYVETASLPTPGIDSIDAYATLALRRPGLIYLASPFFSLGQRWLVDEARRCLIELGLEVFSPVHDVGHGPAETVAPQDLAMLDECDAVFAILDGIDSGTIFEVGYARALKRPVYVLAQSVGVEDLKMIVGSDCRVFDDFVTALHHVAWRT